MRPIRNSAKAIVIDAGRILVVGKSDKDGPWYLLPGGGQNPGETLIEALCRECSEEIGVVPAVGDLRLVREYVGRNHEFASTDSEVHQLEFMFECRIPSGYIPAAGSQPDVGQLEVRWLPLEELLSHRLYPLSLRPIFMEMGLHDWRVYLGDVN